MSRRARIALDALAMVRGGGSRSALMAIGVAAGVAVLSAVMVTASGARETIAGLVAKHGLDMIMVRAGGEVQVFAPTADRGLASLFAEDAAAIEASVPGAVMVSPVQNKRGINLVFQDRALTTRGFGVDADWLTIRRWGVGEGEFISEDDVATMRRVALLGIQVARGLFPDGGAVGSTIRVDGDPFVVKGVFVPMGVDAGGDNWDDRIVVPYTTSMRRMFARPYLEQIVLRVADRRRIAETAERVREVLRVQHAIAPGAPDNFFVREPADIGDAALTATRTVSWLFYAAAIVALLAGGTVITHLTLAGVQRRAREIGLRRAVGARAADVRFQFLVESLAVALAGGTAGVVLGVLAAWALAAGGNGSARVTALPFVTAFVACAAIGVAFGLHPARRASAVEPATALRQGPG